MVGPVIWGAASDAYHAIAEPIIQRYQRWSDARPPWPLPERRGDRQRYPRRGFGLVLECETGERVDTFAGTATKDLCMLPDTTIELRLSEAQLDTLYDTVVRMRIFDLPEHPRPRRTMVFVSSFGTRFVVRAGETAKVFTWRDGDPSPPLPYEWKRLFAVVNSLRRMVTSHPAYRALPPPKGIYID